MTAPLPVRMNWIDRMVTAVAPAAGVKRLQARSLIALSGGYTGARGDRRGLKGWFTRNASPDAATLGDLATLRNRSSDLRRNTPIATGAFNTLRTSVVGSGLRPQPRLDRELLGLTEQQAENVESQIKRIWSWWADTTACDATNRTDFAGLQELALVGQLERGDVLVVRRHKDSTDGRQRRLLGLALSIYEADYLCNPNNKPDSERLISGIEYDEFGEPVRYHLADSHPADLFLIGAQQWHSVPAISSESGERLALHLYEQLRPNQSRGVPFLAPVIESLKQLGTYSEAELMAAVLASFFTVFVKQEIPPVPTGLATPSDQPASAKASEYAIGQGAIVELGAGEDISTANPGRPNDKYEPFVAAILKEIGVALEIPYELLTKRFESSYSASRAALLEAWRGFLRRRRALVSQFCQPCYEWVLVEAVARGLLEAPGFFDNPMIRRAWVAATWSGDAPGQIDEEGAVNAAIARIRAGLSTLEAETLQLTGRDWEENHAQQVKEQRARVAAGLDVEPVAERVVTTATEPTPAEPAPDDTTPERDTPSEARQAGKRPSRTRQEALASLEAHR